VAYESLSRLLQNVLPSQKIPKKREVLKQFEVKMPSRGTTTKCKQNHNQGLTEKHVSNESKINLTELNPEYLE